MQQNPQIWIMNQKKRKKKRIYNSEKIIPFSVIQVFGAVFLPDKKGRQPKTGRYNIFRFVKIITIYFIICGIY